MYKRLIFRLIWLVNVLIIFNLTCYSEDETDFINVYNENYNSNCVDSWIIGYIERESRKGFVEAGIDWIAYDDLCDAHKYYRQATLLEAIVTVHKTELCLAFRIKLINMAIEIATKIDFTQCNDRNTLLGIERDKELLDVDELLTHLNHSLELLMKESTSSMEPTKPVTESSKLEMQATDQP